MKTEKQNDCKTVEKPVQDRAMPSPKREQENGKAETEITKRRPNSMSRAILPLLAAVVFSILYPLSSLRSATVTGNLTDVSINALQTKLTFTPTNSAVINSHGIGIGPATTITATNGAFSLVLDAGPYTVCAPLIKGRDCFDIEVPTGTNSYNITNLIGSGAITVTYVGNRLQYEEAGAAVGYLQFDE